MIFRGLNFFFNRDDVITELDKYKGSLRCIHWAEHRGCACIPRLLIYHSSTVQPTVFKTYRQACVCCWPPTHNQPFSSWSWLGFAGWTKYLQYCRVADECCWKSRVLESSVAGRSSPRSRRLRSMAATAPEGLRQPKDPLAPLHHLWTFHSSYHQCHQCISASSAHHSTNKNEASGKELSYNFHLSLLLSFLYLLPLLWYQSWNALWTSLCLGKVF